MHDSEALRYPHRVMKDVLHTEALKSALSMTGTDISGTYKSRQEEKVVSDCLGRLR